MANMPLAASQVKSPFATPSPDQMTALRNGAAAGMARLSATGSFNGLTPNQNEAAVINQPGNATKMTATPYITPTGTTDYHISGRPDTAIPSTTGVAASNAGAPMASSGGQMPPQSTGNTAPKFDAAGIAASRVAAQRAALAGSVAAYDAQRKQGYDYATKNTQDQRVLDAAMFHEQNNPFSGKYQYDKTNILRNNGIQDTQNQMQYNNDIAAENQKLADFDAGAPGMQQDIQNQLEQQQFQNNIAQAGVTGQYNGNPTLTAQQDTFNNNRNTALDTYNQGQDTIKNNLANDTYNLNAQKQMADLTGYMPDGKGGYMPTTAQQKQDLTDAWTESTNLGYVSPSLSKLTGIPAGTQTQQAKNQAQQIAVSNRNATNSENSTANSNNNANQTHLIDVWKATGKAPAGINGVTEGTAYTGSATPKAAYTADDFIKSMDNTPLVSNIAGMRKVTDPVALEKAILDSGMTPEEMTKAYRAYNIPMK